MNEFLSTTQPWQIFDDRDRRHRECTENAQKQSQIIARLREIQGDVQHVCPIPPEATGPAVEEWMMNVDKAFRWDIPQPAIRELAPPPAPSPLLAPARRRPEFVSPATLPARREFLPFPERNMGSVRINLAPANTRERTRSKISKVLPWILAIGAIVGSSYVPHERLAPRPAVFEPGVDPDLVAPVPHPKAEKAPNTLKANLVNIEWFPNIADPRVTAILENGDSLRPFEWGFSTAKPQILSARFKTKDGAIYAIDIRDRRGSMVESRTEQLRNKTLTFVSGPQ